MSAKKIENNKLQTTAYAAVLFCIFLGVTYLFWRQCVSYFFIVPNDNNDYKKIPYAPVEGLVEPDDGQTPLSVFHYSDSFSNLAGAARLENLEYDYDFSALIFPPDYSWSEMPSVEIPSDSNNYFSALHINNFAYLLSSSSESVLKYYDKRCVEDACLEQRGNSLSYNGKKITLPEAPAGIMQAVSIGKAGDKLLVGITTLNNGSYFGYVYSFKQGKFIRLLEKENIESEYFGLFGFGGDSDDYLIIYGARKGIAYNIDKEKTRNISHFFDFRVMGDGFKPEVVRMERNGLGYWYIFSLSEGRPNLIKLWENIGESEGISGGLSLKKSMSFAGLPLFMPFSVDSESINLLALAGGKYYVLKDFGFKNEEEGIFISKQMPNYKDAFNMDVRYISIPDGGFGLDKASYGLLKRKDIKAHFKKIADAASEERLFSENIFEDGSEEGLWRELPLAGKEEFSELEMEKFRIKIVFPNSDDKFFSPYFSALDFAFGYGRK